MSKTSVMTLRVPVAVRRALERSATQLGYKPAHLGARLVEEGLRRRQFPQIELRDTTAGRVAYLKGTRLTVYWVVQEMGKSKNADRVARDYDVPVSQIHAALAYAAAFPAEIEADRDEVDANRGWLQLQESAWRAGHPQKRRATATRTRK
jgi:uncharacterized protein (DUF433 family)